MRRHGSVIPHVAPSLPGACIFYPWQISRRGLELLRRPWIGKGTTELMASDCRSGCTAEPASTDRTTGRPLTVFLHMHKAAGTAVVRAAMDSGWRLPSRHRNGNLVDDDGKVLLYRTKSNENIHQILKKQAEDGIEFFAMEFDFPPLDVIRSEFNARIFTVFRNPLARAISKFCMDKTKGACDPDMTFLEYINEKNKPLVSSENYYTRLLSRAKGDEDLSTENYEIALRTLREIDKVIVLEHGRLYEELNDLGFCAAPPLRRPQALQISPDFRGFPVEKLTVSDQERVEFCRRNFYDFALYSEFAAPGALTGD